MVERWIFRGLILCWIGVGLTLPFFGAEAFSLQVIGKAAVEQSNSSLIYLINEVRFGPGLAFIVTGLLFIAAATIIIAIVTWKSKIPTRWSAIPLAVGFAVYIPQLQGDPTFQMIRVGVGFVILSGCSMLAWNMRSMYNVSCKNE